MAMPQVHIVALCADLGYGSTRGAQMLSVMLSCGIVSRLLFGWISDHIGGVRTLLLGASLQAVALGLFLPNQSLDVLFLVSALFGLFQGGIIPSYAMIVREYFPPRQAGTRVALTLMATLLGMALGGWASGAIFDLTSSYDAAFVHGIAWNLVTIAITSMLVWGQRRRAAV
jgi:MFS family permease